MSGKTTTGRLADFVASLDYADLPAELVRRVTRQCLDLTGVALAGSGEPAVQAIRHLADAPGAASVWGTTGTARTADAAFVNAAAGHALDYDDMWLPGAHPSAPTFPAAFAVAEVNRRSGRDLIAAQAAGYEVMGRLHSAVSGRFGWHPTAVFGTFGAAAAASRLLGLSGTQTAIAFGIASSMASGIDGQSGTMVKPLRLKKKESGPGRVLRSVALMQKTQGGRRRRGKPTASPPCQPEARTLTGLKSRA